MSDVTRYSTTSPVAPSVAVADHLRKARNLVASLADELTAAALATRHPEQARRLGALSRGCTSLEFALQSLLSLGRRTHA